MNYRIHYFSGTGNTLRAMGLVAALLRERGHEVALVDIAQAQSARGSNTDSSDSPRETEHIFSFPTYAWSPPALVINYFRALPEGMGGKASVLAVDGGGGYSAPATAARILKKRGYDVKLALSASYTENWTQFVEPPEAPTQERLNAEGDRMARSFAEAVLSGKEAIQEAGTAGPVLTFAGLMFRKLGRRILGLTYIADSDCTSCGLCARTCPASVITMRGKPGDSRPEWNFRCENCQRCINLCPARAINTSKARIAVLALAVTLSSVALAAAWLITAPSIFPSGTTKLIADIIGVGAGIVLGHWISLIPFPRLLAKLQRTRVLRRLLEASGTKRSRRYLEPSYKPASTRDTE